MRFFDKNTGLERCAFQDRGCNCDIPTSKKGSTCESCRFYHTIDSGYGWCKALPTFVMVGWCRDVCGLFQEKVRQDVYNVRLKNVQYVYSR